MEAYRELWNMCFKGFTSNENYFKLIGQYSDGTPNSNYKILVDIDNLIDFMLIIF